MDDANQKFRKVIEDRTILLASALRPLLRAQLEEFCHDVLNMTLDALRASVVIPPAPEAIPAPADPAPVKIPPAKPVDDLPPHPAMAPQEPPPATPAPSPEETIASFEGIEKVDAAKSKTAAWRCIGCGKKFPTRRGATTHKRKCPGKPIDA